MVKKKFSGQTLAIVILAIMLLLTITFGGVFAFYSARSNKVSGKIYMATLKISMEWKVSDKSEVVISNVTNLVPGQSLENTALVVKNESAVPIYLVVVYRIEATKKVDPNMVMKKKNGKEQEVQEGWVGHVIPFDLVQATLLIEERNKLQEKETRIAEIASEYDEILDSLTEEEKAIMDIVDKIKRDKNEK